MMSAVSLLGFMAALFTTLALVPQVIRTFQTRDTRGISLWMYAMSSLGVFLWMVYGIVLQAWPIIIANAVTFILMVIILIMKIRLG
ncbi:MAG: SemiSWEET transporter [Magnetococcus sp. THC-1_WYH]